MSDRRDDSHDIAREHFAWARGQGFTNDEILASIGMRPVLRPSDRLVVHLLAQAHRQLLEMLAA